MVPSRQLTRRAVLGSAVATVGVLAGCTALEDTASAGTDDTTEWPFHAGDPMGQAYAPDAAAPREGATERWSVEVPWPSDRPVVAEGLALLPTAEALVAYDVASGAEAWRYAPTDQPWFYSPAVHDGTVYASFREDRGLAALSPEDGSVRWRADVGDPTAPPTVERDGNVFAGSDDGTLSTVTPDGRVEWRYDLFGGVTTIVTDTTTVAAGTSAGEVYVLYETADGPGELWRRKLDGEVLSMAVEDGNHVFVSTFGGKLRRLAGGAHTGRDRWSNADGGTAEGGLVVAENVYGANLAGLTAVDSRSGETAWEVHAGNEYDFTCAPAGAGDTLYAGRENEVVAYKLGGGVGVGGNRLEPTRWRYPLETAPTEGIAVADGALFVPTAGSKQSPARLHALDPA